MRPRRLLPAILALSLLPALPALTACEDRPVHAFVAARYDPVRDCLEPSAAVDVIAGQDPGGSCEARCWESPSGDIYITAAACAAPPDFVDRSADPQGSPCFLALDAHTRSAACDP